jgi:hypothetical protein
MKHADIIKRLVKEVLSTPPNKESCNCGCHSCENVGNQGPVLNENLSTKTILSENMQHHVINKLPITENLFRYGSEAFLNLWAEARKLYEQKVIFLNDTDKSFLDETDLGEFGMYEGKKVPLDLLMEENEVGSEIVLKSTRDAFKSLYVPLLIKIGKDHGKESPLYKDLFKAIDNKDINEIRLVLRDYGVLYDYEHYLGLNEADKKKNPPLGKPKRGGSKKFYVYVRDPKSKRIKKVSFGMAGGGLRAKLNNPKARQAFAKRHDCANKKDKTKASYWSCRLPRYAKVLGFNTTFSGYW